MALQKINWSQIDTITVPSGYTVDIGKIDGPINAIYSENIFLSGVSISDLYLNGGSFSQGVLTLTSNSGNTITISGFEYDFDRYTTGFTYNNANTFTIVDRSGYTLTASFNILTGLTINGNLTVNGNTNLFGGFTATTISATTYQNLPIDPDTYVTNFGYNDTNTFTISDNTGGTFNAIINKVTGLTVNGNLTVTGDTNLNVLNLNKLNANTISATTISGSTFYGNGGNLTNIVLSVSGGTGLSGNSTTGNVVLINTLPDQVVTISGGTGILTGGTYPNFTITNTLPDRTVTISGGTGLEITGSYPNFGINFTGQTNFPYLQTSGGTVTGDVIFQSGLTANTIYATTYENLPIDPNTYLTGFTYNDNKLSLSDNSGNTFNVTIDQFTGLTVNGTLSATTISGGTFYGDGSNLTNIDNIYTVDGSLQSNRVVDLSGNTLSLKLGSNINDSFLNGIDSSGNTIFEIRGTYSTVEVPISPSLYFGLNSGKNAIATYANTAFGSNALSAVTIGFRNTAIGDRALMSLINGKFNIAIGENVATSFTGGTGTTGDDNIFIGNGAALDKTTGRFNVITGTNSFQFNKTGDNNTIYGKSAGALNQSGSDNVYIGYRSGRNGTTSSGNVFIGTNSGRLETGSNLLYIDNTDTSTPLIWGDFTNDYLRFNAKVGVNVLNSTYQFDVNGTSRFSNTVQLDTVNLGLNDVKILTLNTGNTIQYRNISDVLNTVTADTYVTGFTYLNNTLTIKDNSGNTFNTSIDVMTGLTVNGDLTVTGNTNLNGLNLNNLSANTISATTISGGTFYGVGSNKQVIYNSNGILTGSSGFTYDGTNVGIGTTSPTNLLHITGATNPVRIQGLQPSTGNTVIIVEDDGVLKYADIEKLTADKFISGGSFDNRYNVLYFGYNTGGGFRIFLNITGLTANTISSVVNDYLPLSGGTVTGNVLFQSGLTSNTISATTISGGTFYGDGRNLEGVPKWYSESSETPGVLPYLKPVVVTGSSGSGSFALGQNTESLSFDQISFGSYAGRSTTGASRSTFIGYSAGSNGNDNDNSNFIGEVAGSSAKNAYKSNFIGNSAGYNSLNAGFSNFIGANAGYGVTGVTYIGFDRQVKGFDSNFIGNSAGSNAVYASGSTFMGTGAGSNATNASFSNFIGYLAGNNSTNASYSTLIGFNVGTPRFGFSKIGKNNIIIGNSITLPNGTTDSINIGGVLFGTNTNFDTSGGSPSDSPTSNGKIGIGVVSPLNRLHVEDTSDPIRLVGLQSGTTDTRILSSDDNGVIKYRNISDFANIYNSNGTLNSDRTLSTTSGYTLTINPQTTFSPTINAPTGTTIGTLFSPIIGATTTGTSTYVGVDISPTYTGSTSNRTYIDLRTKNAGVVIGSSYGYGSIYGNSNDGIVEISDESTTLNPFRTRLTFRPAGNTGGFNGNWWSWMEQEGYKFRIYAGNFTTGQLSGEWLVGGPSDNTSTFGAYFRNNGNIIIGSTTDSGHKFDSYGVTRIQSNFGVGTISTPSQPSATVSAIGGSLTGDTTGTTYSYRIVAVDNLNYTTPAGTATSVTISGGTTNSVQLTWTAIYGVSQYRIYRTNPWNGTNRYYTTFTTEFSTTTLSYTDTGLSPSCDGSGCNPPSLNQTLRTNISSTGNLHVNGNGVVTQNLRVGGFEINTTSTTQPTAYVGLWRRPGNNNVTFIIEDEQGGAKDKWAFVRRGGYGLTRSYFQGNSSIVNINLGWESPNTNGWDANTLLIDPVINNTSIYTTTIRGIYYNPTLSGMTGVTHIAYQNTTGTNILNSVSGNTLIGTTVDSGNKLFVSGSTNPVRFGGLQSGNTDTRILTSDSNGVIRYRNLDSITGINTYTTTGITVSSQTLTTSISYYGVSYSGNVNLTLPSPVNNDGASIIIKDEGGYSGTYRIRLIPPTGTIDGGSYADMNINYISLTLIARNNNWWII
jgi:hypothetical protein